jgi:hypothetical protein
VSVFVCSQGGGLGVILHAYRLSRSLGAHEVPFAGKTAIS